MSNENIIASIDGDAIRRFAICNDETGARSSCVVLEDASRTGSGNNPYITVCIDGFVARLKSSHDRSANG